MIILCQFVCLFVWEPKTRMSISSELGTLVAFSCNVYNYVNEKIITCALQTRIVWRAVKRKAFHSLSKLLDKTTPRFQCFLLLFMVALLFHSLHWALLQTVHGISALLGTFCYIIFYLCVCIMEEGCSGAGINWWHATISLYFILRGHDHMRTHLGSSNWSDTTRERQLQWTKWAKPLVKLVLHPPIMEHLHAEQLCHWGWY